MLQSGAGAHSIAAARPGGADLAPQNGTTGMTTLIANESQALAGLDAFGAAERRQALAWLAGRAGERIERPLVNMHMHSFFSYNTAGYSPSRLAWEAWRGGLYAAGLCDFDVLDGQEEFLEAGLMLGLRATANLETRAYVREFAAGDINSPGEAGVAYVMGAGFASPVLPGSPQAGPLAALRRQASDRNRALVGRINARLPDIALDYDRDVVPLSPGACPTERHIVRAYRLKAEAQFGQGEDLWSFWAGILGKTQSEMVRLGRDLPDFEEAIRARLVKRGGIGYEPPTDKSFPLADDFFRWVLDCGAVPTATWLDGTSPGESDMAAMLDCMRAKGAAAMNIIPDRNHNIADPRLRSVKLAKLAEAVRAAESMAMPLNIGTEMNKDGQPFADDLDCEALRPYRAAFLAGARIMVGHSLLARYAGYSYCGAQAQADFGNRTRDKNAFFQSVGSLPALREETGRKLADAGQAKALACIRISAAKGRWIEP